jgi:AraC family transcriptional activator of pobA
MAYNPRAIVRELEALMLANPRIQISTIASMMGVGRHTIEKAVRSSKQMSFREYQRSELLRKAQLLLEDSRLSVREIGARLGYDAVSSFSRFMHRTTGRSPRQLRHELHQRQSRANEASSTTEQPL